MAVNKIATFTASADWDHWMALQRVLGYVSRTLEFGIWFGGKNSHVEGIEPIDYYNVDHGIEAHVGAAEPLDTLAFLDFDYAVNPRDYKSLLGFILIVYKGVVFYYFKKINIIAQFIIKVEIIRISETLK